MYLTCPTNPGFFDTHTLVTMKCLLITVTLLILLYYPSSITYFFYFLIFYLYVSSDLLPKAIYFQKIWRKKKSNLRTREGKRFLTHWQLLMRYGCIIIPNLILSSTVVTKRATLPFSHRVYECLCVFHEADTTHPYFHLVQETVIA